MVLNRLGNFTIIKVAITKLMLDMFCITESTVLMYVTYVN